MEFQDLILSFAGYLARILPRASILALYRYEPIAKLIREGLNQAAPEGLSEVMIAAGGNKGMLMLLDLQSEKDYWLGTYEPELQDVVLDLVDPGQIVYDVGANIGFITLLIAKMIDSKGHVYAFEPFPANVDRLMNNIELNGLEGSVSVVNVAVQDRTGKTEFLIGPSTGMGKVAGSAGRSGEDYGESIQVDGISIDDFIDVNVNPSPDIIKLVIEGGEVLALSGMVKLLEKHRPILLIELHGNVAAKASWEILNQKQYRICEMNIDYPPVEKAEDLDWKSYIVAFPNG